MGSFIYQNVCFISAHPYVECHGLVLLVLGNVVDKTFSKCLPCIDMYFNIY